MSTPVRVPDQLHQEIQGAARVLGCTPGELLLQAWEVFRQSPSFKHDFEQAQKAFQTGDLTFLADQYRDRRRSKAEAKAAELEALRGQ